MLFGLLEKISGSKRKSLLGNPIFSQIISNVPLVGNKSKLSFTSSMTEFVILKAFKVNIQCH